MTNIQTLDVTQIEPRFKHPRIFEEFDALKPAEAFIIHNDHDPKPLYYQLLGERGNVFSWEYLENGPEVWKVRIGKNGAAEGGETVGEIVTKDYRKAQVFKKLGIDFCCGGKKTLEEVCEKKGLDIDSVRSELSQAGISETSPVQNYEKWSPGFLADYIVNTHHNYVRESLPFISEISQKVAKVHGDAHPELQEVAAIFERISADLSLHLMKEERILFPFIKKLGEALESKQAIPQAQFGAVDNPTRMMEAEHEQAGEDLAAIRKLTSDYTLPADACTSYRILFQKLQEFENDLFDHVHLENNILFPKALALEKEWVIK